MKRLTIDEAIARERQEAKEQRSHIGTWDKEYSKKCEEYAEEHEQLAEWLEELKELREEKSEFKIIAKDNYEIGMENGYNKAIDDFVYAVKRRFPNDKNGIFHIEVIAEQLKAGGTDEM